MIEIRGISQERFHGMFLSSDGTGRGFWLFNSQQIVGDKIKYGTSIERPKRYYFISNFNFNNNIIAAGKVWHFVKTTGAKIAKFGLKVVESVGEVVGKVAEFIPVIGKPLQQAIHGVSKVAGVISDHIKVKLPDKLQKGMNVMNTADKILGFIPRRRDLLEEEEIFQRRGYGGGNAPYYVQCYDIGMENWEDERITYFEASISARDLD